MIVVRDREAGNIIEIVVSVEAGERLIKKYEEMDKREGLYTPNFYEVAEVEESLEEGNYCPNCGAEMQGVEE